MTTHWERIPSDFREWLESAGATPDEFNGHDLSSRLVFKNQFDELKLKQQQQQQNVSPRSPAGLVWRQQVVPPSEGNKPPKRPDTSSLKTPSSEDGQKKALDYVSPDDEQKVYCSANSTAMRVLALLDAAKKEPELDPKYDKAAKFILKVRDNLTGNSLSEEEVNQNERFYTGAFCDGLNAVLDSGISVLHQGCIGKGSTHSDLSARYVLDLFRSPTLMVGEGKADASDKIRQNTRGQLFNELIRHRRIDSKLRKPEEHEDFRPILLLALNFNYISLDLAFPSTKGGHMENSKWVTFADLPEDTETFWTIPVAMIQISRAYGQQNLPYVLRFIADALQYIQKLGIKPREQFKTPWVTTPASELTRGEKRGDNVTIFESSSGKHVYKEFCYYLREDDGLNDPETRIPKMDQRWPPSRRLLEALGEPYSSWKIENGPFGIKILEYDYIEGESWPTSRAAWIQVLQQVDIMHSLGYVHGDLLPRNLVFSGDGGHVIDFDLTREDGQQYVSGYNHKDFCRYRHKKARSQGKMAKEHDVWALTQMSKDFFVVSDDFTAVSVSELFEYFSHHDVELRASRVERENWDAATGSPDRELISDVTENMGSLVIKRS